MFIKIFRYITGKKEQTKQQQGQEHTNKAKDYTATTKILLQHQQ